jgi:hypothetical protein
LRLKGGNRTDADSDRAIYADFLRRFGATPNTLNRTVGKSAQTGARFFAYACTAQTKAENGDRHPILFRDVRQLFPRRFLLQGNMR